MAACYALVKQPEADILRHLRPGAQAA